MESTNHKKHAFMAGTLLAVCLSFAAIAFGMSNLEAIKYPNGQVASISVSGEGEIIAIPDIATISFTVRESAKTVPEAQKLAQTKIKEGLKALLDLGIENKDTKTLSYTVNPKYESQQVGYCSGYVCPPTKSVITGYEVTQSVIVKVRKVEKAGEVVGVLGKINITEISGPDFTVDDIDKSQADAKALAIKDAKEKAESTAKALGVSLGSITQFTEDGNGGYYPVMYRAEANMTTGMAADSKAGATLPQGESIIKSRVTIVYTLK